MHAFCRPTETAGANRSRMSRQLAACGLLKPCMPRSVPLSCSMQRVVSSNDDGDRARAGPGARAGVFTCGCTVAVVGRATPLHVRTARNTGALAGGRPRRGPPSRIAPQGGSPYMRRQPRASDVVPVRWRGSSRRRRSGTTPNTIQQQLARSTATCTVPLRSFPTHVVTGVYDVSPQAHGVMHGHGQRCRSPRALSTGTGCCGCRAAGSLAQS